MEIRNPVDQLVAIGRSARNRLTFHQRNTRFYLGRTSELYNQVPFELQAVQPPLSNGGYSVRSSGSCATTRFFIPYMLNSETFFTEKRICYTFKRSRNNVHGGRA